MRVERALVPKLLPELFQAECRVALLAPMEARRLGEHVLAEPLLAVGRHAELMVDDLRHLALQRRIGLGFTGIGAIQRLREEVRCLSLRSEQAFRHALLVMRQANDVMRLLREAAEGELDPALCAWCERWLDERLPLVADVSSELGWFVANPSRALSPASTRSAAELVRNVATAIERIEDAYASHGAADAVGEFESPGVDDEVASAPAATLRELAQVGSIKRRED